MFICLDPHTGQGCEAPNPDSARRCQHCGNPLHTALQFHDPGTIVGHYRIARMLGYGRSGAVYQAEDLQVPMRQVALKETLQAMSIHQFKREFDVLSTLQHANLPRYYDMFTDGGHGYLVMELIPGKSLQDLLEAYGKPLPEETLIVGYATQLCDAISYLHAQNPPVLHRDIKPENIRITPEGVVKLVDFGLVKRGGRLQHTSPLVRGLGTPGYSPPEQYHNDTRRYRTDQRSDMYSIGATLYHLLTGMPLPQAIERTRSWPDPLISPSHYNPAISRHISSAIMTAMSIQPEDRYADVEAFRQALLEETMSLSGHSGSVFGVAYSPDGQTFASASAGSTVRLWNSDDASLLHPLNGHTNGVHSLAYSPGGQILASAGANGTVRLWSVKDGSLLYLLTGHARNVRSLAWSPDGQMLASAGDDYKVRLWCVGDGHRIFKLEGHTQIVRCVAWNPEGTLIASASDDSTIRLWKRTNGEVVRIFRGHAGSVCSVAWSPDGQILASGGEDSTVRIWNVEESQAIHILTNHSGPVTSVAWSPSGKTLASVSTDKYVCLWRVSDGKLLRTLSGHHDAVNGVAYSPDGKLLVSVSNDKTVRLWPVSNRRVHAS